jgi:hypothetical protein
MGKKVICKQELDQRSIARIEAGEQEGYRVEEMSGLYCGCGIEVFVRWSPRHKGWCPEEHFVRQSWGGRPTIRLTP